MENVADILFEYLRKVIYDSANAVLDVDNLPENFRDFCNGLLYFVDCVTETKQLAQSLSRGELQTELPAPENEIASPLKSLHAALRHLTWQTQQIASGDYQQRLGFMGELSSSFNAMVEQLEERQRKLESEINQIQSKTASLEQSNLLLTSLMHNVSQQIFVIDRDTHAILLMNDAAAKESDNDGNYADHLIRAMTERSGEFKRGSDVEVVYAQGGKERYLIVKPYQLEWNGANAEVLVINDVSATRNKIKELEVHAYHDSITKLYNRAYGMLTLESWLRDHKRFVLVFVDLDNLKHINDEFGHPEGDMYILNASKHLKTFSPNAVVCRIGGDEFMLLVPDIGYDAAMSIMAKVNRNFQKDEFLQDKTYSYNISYGICAIEEDNTLSASDTLSIADERMYENKRMKKRTRQKP